MIFRLSRWTNKRQPINIKPETLLESAFERMKTNILKRNITPRKFHPRNSTFEPKITSKKISIEQITITEISNHDLDLKTSSPFQKSEVYTLQITSNGTTIIKITSPQSGILALETFSQLFYTHSQSPSEAYTPYAPVSITDYPAFQHRGLNLDISRNWISPDDVMRTIKGMGANKLNRLHLHASDAQSWPLEVPSLPDLALKGAYDPSQIWAVADLEKVQRHGLYYGVEVFLEIDLPGHTTAISNAYPNLITSAYKQPWTEFALEPPAGQLKLNSSAVSSFVTTLLHDLLPRSSQFSSHFHMGGDELNNNAYLFDPTVRSSSPLILQPLIQSFINRVLSITVSHSLTPIVWEEILLDWNLTLPQNAIVQTWRSNTALAAVLAKGHKALFGANTHWYLDCGHGAFIDPNPSNPDTPATPPYLDYCNPYKNWRLIYSYDPLKGIPSEQQYLVVGGEIHLWGELTDSVSLDGTLWPRIAAAAEVLWRGTGRKADESTTRRLALMRERLIAKGLNAGMVQMEWCLRNKGGCTM